MLEETNEAKNFDSMADEFLSKEGMETPTDSSTENKPEETDAQAKTSGAEPAKTEQVKAVEADESLSIEEKIAKIKEILGDDEKALDAYIKQKGYHNDPAWQKQRDLIEKYKKEAEAKSKLNEEESKALAEFNKYRNSPEGIQASMKAQGFTQEAIDKKLQESGFEVKNKPQDDVAMVVKELGLKLDDMKPDEKIDTMAYISDIAKVANILINDRLGRTLPQKLAPIEQKLTESERKEAGNKHVNTMRETIKTEGVLDFDKDINPALNKFMDDNPGATQQDVMEHFKSISHSLTVERLKTGKKKEQRDEMKINLRQNVPFGGGNRNLPQRTGNFDKDADAFLESLNA